MPIIATDPEVPRTVEVVRMPPTATIVPGQALTRFLSDPAGLKHDALRVLDIKVKPVETVEAASRLSDQISEAATLLKNIEARRKQHVEPLKKEAKGIDEEAARWRGPVENFITQAKAVILAFNKLETGRRQREEEARQEAIRDASKALGQAEIMGNAQAIEAASVEIMRHEAAPAAQPITGYKTEAGSNSTRKRWVIEVVNAADVPDAYLVPDLARLQAAVNAHPNPAELVIPGCHIEEKETLVTRTR